MIYRKKSKKLPWDYVLVDDRSEIVPYNMSVLRGAIIQVSSPRMCTNMILSTASMIYYETQDNRIMVLGNLAEFYLAEVKEEIEVESRKVEPVNIGQYLLVKSGKKIPKVKIPAFDVQDLGDDATEIVGNEITISVNTIHIGYRRFILTLGVPLGLVGTVENKGEVVLIRVFGMKKLIEEFKRLLYNVKPPKDCVVHSIIWDRVFLCEKEKYNAFTIKH